MRIFIIESVPILASALPSLLSNIADFEVIGVCDNVSNAVLALQNDEPDILLLDLLIKEFPNSEASDLKENEEIISDLFHGPLSIILKLLSRNTKIVVLTKYKEHSIIAACMQLGVLGYVNKDASLDELVFAFKKVFRGRKYISTDFFFNENGEYLVGMLDTLVEAKKLKRMGRYKENKALETISPRDKEILKLLSQGYTSNEIGDTLAMSKSSVEERRQDLLRKFNVKNTTHLIKFMVDCGII
ncbi:LuxR C-terminal-related transcriptional regulator [Runella sp.]|uniref:LuxR C-terminal-related transcriptional regulator n=1 Tax=Runella sp. TaxID=1960881 RepID=UPI003D0CBF98